MIKFSSLLALFAGQLNFSGWKKPKYQRQYGASRQVRAAFKLTGRPTDKRHWHTGKGAQIDRIDDAQEKRAYRAEKRNYQAMRTFNGMHSAISTAYAKHDAGFICPLNLNPFYVAK